MRFVIVGGGPAGLELAILLRRADRGHEVTVIEQNPPDATYGWGVVFSAGTLTELRDADYETWLEVDRELVRWGSIDVHRGGQRVRVGGQGFSAIARLRLLGCLQRRAEQLGVRLEFERRIEDLSELDGDVIVGADGVHSVVRAAHKEFGTTEQHHANRFAWFGTDRVFEAFTFVFLDTPEGPFTAHAYPFDAHHSTFIVECGPDTFHRAGLDRMDETASLAYCEALFADVLAGRRLLSNRSIWRTFTTIRNRSWHHGRVVLIGDAAHTAHFSIGSGTKLAMEDAIALAKAFVAHPDDIDAALVAYELERRGPVERFQQAAVDSARYFEGVAAGRYRQLDTPRFVFHLMTRSGRITRADLIRRDPRFVAVTDRWVRQQSGLPATLVGPPPAATPLQLGGLDLAGRVVAVPAPRDDATDGVPGGATAADLTAAASQGAALVVTDLVAVHPHGRITPGSPGLYDDAHTAAWAAIATDVHRAGGRLALRLGHAGRRGACAPRTGGLDRPLRRGGWPLLAPAPRPYTPVSPVPEALTVDAVEEVVGWFVAAARRAATADVDLLLLDAADGYLLASFLSPLTNPRDDELGGDPDRRMTLARRVVGAVREVWPGVLGVRLLVDDLLRGGLTLDDGVAAARALVAAGVELIDVAAGHSVPHISADTDLRPGYLVAAADRVRQEVGVPVIAHGGITTLDEADTLVAAGRADLVVLDGLEGAG